jgi:sulfate adenylyltransferase
MTAFDSDQLISPYGGRLVDLLVPAAEREELHERAGRLPAVRLSERALCDLELLASGGFSPLDRFLAEADYRRVLGEMRLAAGTLFPLPVTLTAELPAGVGLDEEVALRGPHNEVLGTMLLDEIYEWDLASEARAVLGSIDPRHPLVAEMHGWGRRCLSGALRLLQVPQHRDFRELRLGPAETRQRLAALGRARVVAFQTRNPLHRAHEELVRRAAETIDGTLLLHPVVGLTKPGDVDSAIRVRTYQALVAHSLGSDRTLLALLPLAMRMAGPREALWHAIIRRNFGASHLIVGRDHASPGRDSEGRPYWGPYAAQELVAAHATELGVQPLAFEEMVYLEDEDRYEEASRVPAGARTLSLSGTDVRDRYLARGERLPAWFTRPEVAEILAESYPPRHRQGVCLWFTGLSGSGKSTTAEELAVRLEERGRQVTLLDGDVVRTHLSKGLGFSRADRDTNVLRIAFVAAEIVRHGGVVLAAAVSPYRAARNQARAMVGAERFVEVFVDTPLAECERRDTKGLYAQARRGELPAFTGISDPYEAPIEPEMALDTVGLSAIENAEALLRWLVERGFVKAP